MAIKLHPDTEKGVLDSIKKYAAENLAEEMGDLKASLLLEFILKEVGPVVYNQAIRDAAAYMQEKAGEMDGTLYEDEGGYWVKKSHN